MPNNITKAYYARNVNQFNEDLGIERFDIQTAGLVAERVHDEDYATTEWAFGSDIPVVLMGFRKWVKMPENEDYYIFARSLVKIKIPEAPHEGMKPVKMKLYLADFTGTVFNVPAMAGEVGPTNDGIRACIECIVAPHFLHGYDVTDPKKYWSWNPDHGGVAHVDWDSQLGVNWAKIDGRKFWKWVGAGSAGFKTDFPYQEDATVGVCKNMHLDNLVNFSAPGGLDQKWWILDFEDYLITKGLAAGGEFTFLVFDTKEDHNTTETDRIRAFSSSYTVLTGALPFPIPSLGTPTRGILRPFLTIEWAYIGDIETLQVTELSYEGRDDSDRSIDLKWKNPEKILSDEFFLRHVLEVFDLSNVAYLDYTQEIKDRFMTNVLQNLPIGKYGTFAGPKDLALTFVSEYGMMDYDDTEGVSTVIEFPKAFNSVRMFNESGVADYAKLTKKAYIGASSFKAIVGPKNVKAIPDVLDYKVFWFDLTSPTDSPLWWVNIGQYVVIYDKTNLEHSCFRQITAWDEVNNKVTLNEDIPWAMGIGNARIYFVHSVPDLLRIFVEESIIDYKSFGILNQAFTDGDTHIHITNSEEFENGDWLCFMVGSTVRMVKITSYIPGAPLVSKIGVWTEKLIVGTPYFKVRPYTFVASGFADIRYQSYMNNKLKSGMSDAHSVLIDSLPPIAVMDANFINAARSQTIRYFGHNSGFFGNDEMIGLGHISLFFYPNYNPSSPPVPPDPRWPEVPPGSNNDWLSSRSGIIPLTYFDKAWMFTIPIQNILASPVPGKMRITNTNYHELETGNIVRISGTAHYDGEYQVTVIDGVNFDIVHSNDGNEAIGITNFIYGYKTMGMRAWNGKPWNTLPYGAGGNHDDILSTAVYAKVLLAENMKYNCATIIDLALLTDGYRTEEVSDGKASEIRKSVSGVVDSDQGIENIGEISLASRATTIHATHPIAIVEAWRVAEGLVGLPDDLLTLIYLKENRALAKLTIEGRVRYTQMTDCNKSREHGYLEQRDWRATFQILGP